MNKLSEDQVVAQLSDLPGWKYHDQTITKEFDFVDFDDAFNFMQDVASIAKKLNHHPDWSNSYNKVFISLSTHSASGITDLDIQFAKTAEQLAKQKG